MNVGIHRTPTVGFYERGRTDARTPHSLRRPDVDAVPQGSDNRTQKKRVGYGPTFFGKAVPHMAAFLYFTG